jgi:diguanylate cyclase (GGDEF)-like protein
MDDGPCADGANPKVTLLDAALDGIRSGLSIWTPDFKLAFWNRPFLEIYNLKPHDVTEGAGLDEIEALIVAAGNHQDRSGTELYRLYRDGLSGDAEHGAVAIDEKLCNDRIINLKRTRLPGAGWVILHDDVTELRQRERADAALAVRLQAAVANMAEGLCMFDAERRLVISNQQYAEIYGLPPQLVMPGTPHAEIVAYRLAHGMEPFEPGSDFEARHEELIKELKPASEIVQLKNGRIIRIAHQSLPIGGWVATHLDITEQKQRETQLTERFVQLDAAINNTPQGLCMFDQNQRLIVSNRLYATMYRIAPEEIRPGMTLEEIVALRLAYGNEPKAGGDGYLKRRLDLVVNNRDDGDVVQLKDGRVIAIMHHPMQGGGWVSTHQDITEQQRTHERIQYLARHDALTDLANRTLLREHIEELQPRLARGEQLAVLAIDLDHFKNVNDTLGHGAGDALLKQVAARLTRCCRETDLVARLGGDEFAILQVGIDQPLSGSALARRIVDAIAQPFDIQEHQFVIGASIGISVAPLDGRDADTLMKCADLALYRSKAEGRSTFHFYESGMDAVQQRRRAIEHGLRRALSRNELVLAFQPLINVAEHRIKGFEALLRWNSPEHGLVSPADFIPVAEDTGLIVQIGEWVLREACAVAATWPEEIEVSVNLSPVQFKNRGLVEQVESALRDSGLRSSRLDLEITESVMLIDSKATLATLHRLHDLGVKLSMDDFGTGYSSLSYLRSFPFDKIKIDRSFVRDSSNNGDAKAIVKAVIGLGQSLGMATTAEGVETEAQLALVREQGCTEAQGFLFSKPLPASDVGAWVAQFRPGRAAQ